MIQFGFIGNPQHQTNIAAIKKAIFGGA